MQETFGSKKIPRRRGFQETVTTFPAGSYTYAADPRTHVEIVDLPPYDGAAESVPTTTPWKQAAQKAEGIVLALNSINERYGTAIEVATFVGYGAVFGPVAGSVAFAADKLVAELTEPAISLALQQAGSVLRGMDPTMTVAESESLAMPLIAIAAMALPGGKGLGVAKSLAARIEIKTIPMWSSTQTLTAPANAIKHWRDHAKEFPQFTEAKQYVDATRQFVTTPPTGTLTKTRPNGDVLFYDPVQNIFAVRNADGVPKTMFKPSAGLDYWNRQ